MAYAVQVSIGQNQLSGVPVDLAFDNQRMFSGMPNLVTPHHVGPPIPANGKSPIRNNPGTCIQAVWNMSEPSLLFVAVPNALIGTGVVDVIVLDGSFSRTDVDKFNPGIQSILAPNVQVVMDYLRQ